VVASLVLLVAAFTTTIFTKEMEKELEDELQER